MIGNGQPAFCSSSNSEWPACYEWHQKLENKVTTTSYMGNCRSNHTSNKGNWGNKGNHMGNWCNKRNKDNRIDNCSNKDNTDYTDYTDSEGNIQADKLSSIGIRMAHQDKHRRCRFEQQQFQLKESPSIRCIGVITIYTSCIPYRISSIIFWHSKVIDVIKI